MITTFLSRVEPEAAPELGLPEHHALAATIFLGVPERQVTKLRREPVERSRRGTASTAPRSTSDTRPHLRSGHRT